jgi:zinc protease
MNQVTIEQVQAAARKYLVEDNRTVGYFIPKNDSEDEPVEEASEVETDENAPKLSQGLKRLTLPNGLRFLVVPKPGTGVVSIAPKFLNGGQCFSDGINGFAANMVADMLTYGAKGLSKDSLARTLENMGTNLDFSAGNFFNSIWADGKLNGISVVNEDFPKFLSLLSKAVRTPLFNKKELGKLTERTRGDLENSRTDEESLAETAFYQALYGSEHPYYQYDVDETLSDLNELTRADLVKFHQSNYGPASTIIAVVGDITVEQATDLMEKNFGSWTGPELKPVVVPEVALPAAPLRKEVFLKDKASATIMIGLPSSLKQSDADFFAAKIANSALGGSTIDARLGMVIRVEEGLTYGVYSKFDDLSFGYAPWIITLTVNPENIQRAIELVQQVTSKFVEEGIGEEELLNEKNRIVGNYYIKLSSPEALANQLATFEAIGVGAEAVDSYADGIMAQTVDQVNAAIRKYFTLDHAVTVIAGTLPNRQ